LISLAYSSTANQVIIPIQNILGLGEEARMNNPSHDKNNWTWRLDMNDITSGIEQQLLNFARVFGKI